MADEGATFYYVSKQNFNFDKSYNHLKKIGFFLKDPNTHLITVQRCHGEYIGKEFEHVQNIIYKDKSSGVNLYLDSGERTFWSFYETSSYFAENFIFNYIGDLEIEEKSCEMFTNLAIKKITELGTQFLGFTLDMYGETEDYDFEKVFSNANTDILNDSYISDLTILSKDKMNQFILGEKIKVIEVNRDFNCTAKKEKFANYLESLL